MTDLALPATGRLRKRLVDTLWRRQLQRYPSTGPRMGYLAIVVLTTIMLYYLYYVEGAVTPLLLPYYHMSFQYFLYLLVVSNAIGAFTAFIGGLSDKIGRANLTIYGTLVVGIGAVGRRAPHPFRVRVRRGLLRDWFRGGHHLGLDPGAHARLLASDGAGRRHGASGHWVPPWGAWRPAWWPRTPSRTCTRGRTSSSSRVSCAWAWWSSPSSSCGNCLRSCATS